MTVKVYYVMNIHVYMKRERATLLTSLSLGSGQFISQQLLSLVQPDHNATRRSLSLTTLKTTTFNDLCHLMLITKFHRFPIINQLLNLLLLYIP